VERFRIPWEFPKPVVGENFSSLGPGGIALSLLVLGFVYFVMKWATDRMKDWESVKEKEERHGAPALVCWIAGVGALTPCLLATQVFAGLYFRLNGPIYWWHGLMALGMLITCGYFYVILLKFIVWYFRHGGHLDPLTCDTLNEICHWHRVLLTTVPLFIVTGVGSLLELGWGDPEAGLMGLLYELCAAIGIGAYCSVRADLLPRACVDKPRANAA
jgi:hypothetical protein